MGQLGLVEGLDYDTYTVQGPTSGVGNGIGSAGAHGANADQLAGYNTIVYFTGNLSTFTLSDGSDSGSNDKGDDLGVLTAWHALPDLPLATALAQTSPRAPTPRPSPSPILMAMVRWT